VKKNWVYPEFYLNKEEKTPEGIFLDFFEEGKINKFVDLIVFQIFFCLRNK